METEADPEESAEVVLDRLIAANVVAPVEAEEVVLTDEFEQAVEDRATAVRNASDEELRDELDRVVDTDNPSALLEFRDVAAGVLAEYLALAGAGLSRRDRLRAMTVLDSLRDDSPAASGAPEPFVPVHGERMSFLVKMYERAIVYVWREDCDPCDLVKEDFETTFEAPPADIALFAVYGPDTAPLLQDRFGVRGAPVTLFFLHGEVDARLHGAHDPQVLQNEIEILRELG